MIDLLVDILSFGALWLVVTILLAAIVLVEGEKRQKRQACEDIGERARVRAEAHEAIAQSRLYPDAGPGRKS